MKFWNKLINKWKEKRDRKRSLKVLKIEKEEATKNGEPWVTILKIELEGDGFTEGSFDLDWNDIFITRLIKAGYRGDDDNQLVDNWLHHLCYHIAAGTFEDDMADPDKRKEFQKRLANGRTEHY